MNTWIFGRNPGRTLIRACFLAVLTVAIALFVVRPVRIQGQSMYPTYVNGAFSAIFPSAYTWQEPRRGDVVAIRIRGARMFYLKRILGLPGETVEFKDGRLLVDGKGSPEPYLHDPGTWTIPPVQLGPDEFYVAGDNRKVRWQDHTMGRVQRAQISGRAW
ncbi:MAG TPA: signal peptidase I [Kiritimatiellia bacterium]|nr:signal peptidase I [Kiritimatiellia bacterium]